MDVLLDAPIRYVPCAGVPARPASAPRLASLAAALCAATVLVAGFAGVSAQAAEPQRAVTGIAAQPLEGALAAFMAQTGLEVIYVSKVAEGVASPGCGAGLAPREALTALLAGTGLEYRVLDDRTFALAVGSPPRAPPSPAAPATTVPAERGPAALASVEVWSSRRPLQTAFLPATGQERRSLESAARELEQRIENNGRLYGRPELDAYLQGILDRLVSFERPPLPGPVRVRVIRDISANAFVLPNGSVYVTTELLYQLDSEAEIASVLGHELTHFANSHALIELRAQNNKVTLIRVAGFALGVLGGIAANHAGGVQNYQPIQSGALPRQTREVWMTATVNGYSRELEREADYEGLRRMAIAGYDPAAGVEAFEHLRAAAPDKGERHPAHFSSHPKLEERIASYRSLVADGAGRGEPSGFTGRDVYTAATASVGLDQAELLLDSGAFERVRGVLARERERRDSARLAYLEGEATSRALPRTPEADGRALAAYQRAATMPDPPVATFRQEGVLYRRLGDRDAAAAAYRAYLDRAPQAVDAPLVKMTLATLESQPSDAPQ